MFEQAILDSTGGSRRPVTFMISAAGQTAALALIVAATIANVPGLPPRLMFTAPVPFSPAPKPQPVAQEAVVRGPSAANRPFVAPREIFPRIAQPVVLADEAMAAAPSPAGVEGGLPGHGGPPCVVCQAAAELPARPAPAPTPAVKPQAAAPHVPVHVSSGVQAAKLIHQVKPLYPPLAKQARIQGAVRLEAIISRNGLIQDLRVASGHPLLAPAAVEAVRQWRYQPTLLNNEPVEVITQIEVHFTLQ
jgi:periplasmic protein TonB